MEDKEENILIKILKIFDDMADGHPENIIKITEDPNSQLGTATKVWECVRIIVFHSI